MTALPRSREQVLDEAVSLLEKCSLFLEEMQKYRGVMVEKEREEQLYLSLRVDGFLYNWRHIENTGVFEDGVQ